MFAIGKPAFCDVLVFTCFEIIFIFYMGTKSMEATVILSLKLIAMQVTNDF